MPRTEPGVGHPNWKGGTSETRGGYLREYVGCVNGHTVYKFQHRRIAEVALGRLLKPGEVVHHIDGNKLNNANNNLLICSQSYHGWLHRKMADMWMKEHIHAKRVG